MQTSQAGSRNWSSLMLANLVIRIDAAGNHTERAKLRDGLSPTLTIISTLTLMTMLTLSLTLALSLTVTYLISTQTLLETMCCPMNRFAVDSAFPERTPWMLAMEGLTYEGHMIHMLGEGPDPEIYKGAALLCTLALASLPWVQNPWSDRALRMLALCDDSVQASPAAQ